MITALTVLILSLVILFGCAKNKEDTGDLNTVRMVDFAFEPETLTVKVGTTVIWVNEDSAAHKIKSSTFNSQNMKRADSFSQTFSEPGVYEYICDIHPSMTGKITVE